MIDGSVTLRQLAKNIYSQWFLQSLRLITGFITTVFVARIIGPEGYGVVASIFIFYDLFGFVIDPGFRGSIVRYISVYSGSGRDYIPIIAGFLNLLAILTAAFGETMSSSAPRITSKTVPRPSIILSLVA